MIGFRSSGNKSKKEREEEDREREALLPKSTGRLSPSIFNRSGVLSGGPSLPMSAGNSGGSTEYQVAAAGANAKAVTSTDYSTFYGSNQVSPLAIIKRNKKDIDDPLR